MTTLSKDEREQIVRDSKGELSTRKMCQLMDIDRKRLYRKRKGESEENLKIMKQIDLINLEEPTFGVLRMQDALLERGLVACEERVRRLMRLMGVEAIYPRRNLTKRGLLKYKYPYLLRNKEIRHPNEVWQIDITYIPMAQGFMYLTAIIDVYSRTIVGWQLSNSMDKESQTDLLRNTIAVHGKPEIINSDQGSQYTCANWVEYLKEEEIQISMSGAGRATDNVYIERFFRSLKLDHVHLYPADNGLELYEGISKFIDKYNHRSHQGIGRRKPMDLYRHAA